MHDYRGELERRIREFARYSELMDERTRTIAKRSCFLIFSEKQDSRETSVHRTTVVARTAQPVLAYAGSTLEAILGGPNLSSMQALPDTDKPRDYVPPAGGPLRRKEPARFVQFLFRRRFLAMDLPNTIIYPPEIRRLCRERSGFVREAEVGIRNSFPEHVKRFDPITKSYIYGDALSAAKDVAYLFFDLWRFRVDSPLYVKASSFRGPYKWERGLLVR